MKKIVDMDSSNLPTKYPASEEQDLMDSCCIGYDEAIDDCMKILNAAPDYFLENESIVNIQKLYEDFRIYVNNLSEEEFKKHIEKVRRMMTDFNEYASVSQLAEGRPCKADVVGPSPTASSI